MEAGLENFDLSRLVLLPAAALFAAHLAFIAADKLRPTFRGEIQLFFSAFLTGALACLRFAVARAADFLAAFNACLDSASCNLRLNLASFCGPSRRRFSSCWIFFLNFFSFIIVLLPAPAANLTIGGLELMTKSRRCHDILWPECLDSSFIIPAFLDALAAMKKVRFIDIDVARLFRC